jgi:hypothetical protein
MNRSIWRISRCVRVVSTLRQQQLSTFARSWMDGNTMGPLAAIEETEAGGGAAAVGPESAGRQRAAPRPCFE